MFCYIFFSLKVNCMPFISISAAFLDALIKYRTKATQTKKNSFGITVGVATVHPGADDMAASMWALTWCLLFGRRKKWVLVASSSFFLFISAVHGMVTPTFQVDLSSSSLETLSHKTYLEVHLLVYFQASQADNINQHDDFKHFPVMI